MKAIWPSFVWPKKSAFSDTRDSKSLVYFITRYAKFYLSMYLLLLLVCIDDINVPELRRYLGRYRDDYNYSNWPNNKPDHLCGKSSRTIRSKQEVLHKFNENMLQCWFPTLKVHLSWTRLWHCERLEIRLPCSATRPRTISVIPQRCHQISSA